MGIDYKKKYLKYKNKYLEAKKIYGGGDMGDDESIQVKIETLKTAIEKLRNSGISKMIDGLLTKCNECKTQEEVEKLEKEVEDLRKQVAEAGKQNVEEGDPNDVGNPEVISEDNEEPQKLHLLENMQGSILENTKEKAEEEELDSLSEEK
jgi:hypothetical protein